MIILDLHQVLYSNLWQNPGLMVNGVNPELLRHMTLNSIRHINLRFNRDDLIIACDGRRYWRREFFPYYKANRRKGREKSELDWQRIFSAMNDIRQELKDHFPYRVIEIEGAEADDVIASLCHKFGAAYGQHNEHVIQIVSGDKDFGQLQSYSNVAQYDPVLKRDIVIKNPSDFLLEHVIRGDRGDGVPNILSDDDVFVTDKRQKPITAKRMAELKKSPGVQHFNRNDTLINLSRVPVEIQGAIVESYYSQGDKDRSQLMSYFMKKGLRNLLESVGDF